MTPADTATPPAITPTSFQGQPALQLRAPDGAQATVLLHGAHLVSWIPAGGQEQLYLSPASAFGAGASVRGGVPVIFPQFNERGPLPRHGLVRTRAWQPVLHTVRGGVALAALRFEPTDETAAIWPVPFATELTVSVSGAVLEVELAVEHTGEEGSAPFAFTAALHTYLRSADALKLQLEGLQGVRYEDALKDAPGHIGNQQWGDVLTVVGAIDRVYYGAANPLVLRELGRKLGIAMEGFADVVVWNPGPEAAATMKDLPAADWQRMLCVEAARIGQPVRLAAGEEWLGRQTLTAG